MNNILAVETEQLSA